MYGAQVALYDNTTFAFYNLSHASYLFTRKMAPEPVARFEPESYDVIKNAGGS